MMREIVLVLSCLSVLTTATKSPDVLVFGRNDKGQLGIPSTVVRSPEALKFFDGVCVKQADVNEKNGIFVTCDGKVYLTGTNIAPKGRYSLSPEDIAKVPVQVEDLAPHTVVMATLGDAHIIALTQQGKVMTWGFNHDGQLGYGNEAPFAANPLEVTSLSDKNIRFVSSGGNRSAAISDDGKLYMWGSGKMGEMGDGTTTSHRKPSLVKSFLSNNERICHVSIGNQHVAAVTNAGDLYTWGDGAAGQLGLGDFGIQKKKPMPISRLRRNVCYAAAGEDFTTAITQDERMFLWGSNGYPAPFEKAFFQGIKPRQVGCGSAHVVVLLANGTLATWGSKRYGQVGRDLANEFTLDPSVLPNNYQTSQLAVGRQQTIMLSSGIPAPSLCPCLDGFFSHWRAVEKYVTTCTEEESLCPDGSCCGSGETCCPIDSSAGVSPVLSFRAIDEKQSGAKSSNYRCMPAKDAVCCEASSALGCQKGHTCNLDASPKRCEPESVHSGMSEEDRASRSAEPIRSKVVSKLPGFVVGSGSCGPRKETCPDDTCCGKDQTCCPKSDGSFGCCTLTNAKCCKSGCCAEGYECDDSGLACVQKKGSQVISRVAQDTVEGHCGGGKRQCPDRSCCAEGNQCCVLNDGFFGCCPFANGVCCMDGSGCCPSNHRCDVAKSECVGVGGADGKEEIRFSMKATPRNTPQRSAVGEVTCPNNMACQYPGTCCAASEGNFACCDFVNGTCCGGGLGCCPNNFDCDLATSTCKPLQKGGSNVPMKFTRDPKPVQHVPKDHNPCEGKTRCTDNTCCPVGSTCCTNSNGETSCCDYMEAKCCSDGGCCAAGHICDSASKSCKDPSGKQSYAYLSSQKSSPPAAPQNAGTGPGKCYPDETHCSDGFCCPRSATCCNKGFGQTGCCPHTHGVCCEGGGCCPGGSTCDVKSKVCTYPNNPDKQSAPMLLPDTPHPPEAVWDKEECWVDEQTCSADGGCCLKTETCCSVNSKEEGLISACCPYENGVCCASGGCCPFENTCNDVTGTCTDFTGKEAPVASVKGSAMHPLAGLAEIDCPDGSVCGPFDTCCSLGFDEEWGEVIYGCCEFENAVCCSEFEGCCPSGYECNAETKTCTTDGREISGGSNSPTDPPPTYVCLWPQTQCPNGKCCEENEQCAEQSGGNFKCLPRGYVSCNNGTHGCPNHLYCDTRNGESICSSEEENDPQVKKDLLRKYWGDDVSATCNTLLLQSSVSTHDDSFTPETKVERPPAQYWFPKRLVLRSKAVSATAQSLPTVLASKICQHLTIVNSTALAEMCYMSNANGHFLMEERDRVKQLVDEYTRRTCLKQDCLALPGRIYQFQAEELDPCPCREKPTPAPIPPNLDNLAGSNDAVIAHAMAVVERAEEHANAATAPTDITKPMFIDPIHEVADEKPASASGMGSAVSGAVPVSQELPAEPTTKFTLVSPTRDAMQLTQPLDVTNGFGDNDMINAHRVETFMGKEACKEDEAEAAVDLDGEEAVQLDARAEGREGLDTSLAQMESNTKSDSRSMMPDLQ